MKITIAGNTATIASDLTKDQILALSKHRPAALKIVEDKTVTFAVAFNEKGASVTDNGVIFDSVDDANGKVFASVGIPAGTEDKAAYVAEKFGVVSMKLKQVEAVAITEAVSLGTQLARIASEISVVSVTAAE